MNNGKSTNERANLSTGRRSFGTRGSIRIDLLMKNVGKERGFFRQNPRRRYGLHHEISL